MLHNKNIVKLRSWFWYGNFNVFAVRFVQFLVPNGDDLLAGQIVLYQ